MNSKRSEKDFRKISPLNNYLTLLSADNAIEERKMDMDFHSKNLDISSSNFFTKIENDSEISEISSPDIFIRNASPPFSVSDDETSTRIHTDLETDSPFHPKKEWTTIDRSKLDIGISTSSAGSKSYCKEQQVTRSYNSRSSTPINPFKVSPFNPDVIEDISIVKVDSKDTYKIYPYPFPTFLEDGDAILHNETASRYLSISDVTNPQFESCKTHLPENEDLPNSIVQGKFDFSNFQSELSLKKEMDITSYEYMIPKELKTFAIDTGLGKSSIFKSYESTNESPTNQYTFENPLEIEWSEIQQAETSTLKMPQTEQDNQFDCSFSSNYESILTQTDGSDNQLDALDTIRRELDLESISDEDFDGDIYEELSNILNDVYSEDAKSCSSKTETGSTIRKSPASNLPVKKRPKYENLDETSFSMTCNTEKGFIFSTASNSEKEHVAQSGPECEHRSVYFSNNEEHDEASNAFTIADTVENLFSSDFSLVKGHTADTASEYQCESTCFSHDREHNEISNGKTFTTTKDSLFSTSPSLLKNHVSPTAFDGQCRNVYFSTEVELNEMSNGSWISNKKEDSVLLNATRLVKEQSAPSETDFPHVKTELKNRKKRCSSDIMESEETSNEHNILNTEKDSLFSTSYSLVSEHVAPTVSDGKYKRVQFSNDKIKHELIANNLDISSSTANIPRFQACNENKHVLQGAFSTSYKAPPNSSEDSNSSYRDSTVPNNQISLIEIKNKRNMCTTISEEEPTNSTIEKSHENADSHVMKEQRELINQENANVGKIGIECSSDGSHITTEGESMSLGFFGLKSHEIETPSSVNPKNLKRYLNKCVTFEKKLNVLEANCEKYERDLHKLKNNFFNCKTNPDHNNLNKVEASESKALENTPLLADCTSVKIKATSYAQEVMDQSLSTVCENFGPNLYSKNPDDIQMKTCCTQQNIRIVQEDLFDDYLEHLKIRNTHETEKSNPGSSSSSQNPSSANSKDVKYENMDTMDSINTKSNVLKFAYAGSKEGGKSLGKYGVNPLQLKELYDIDKNVARAVIQAVNDLGKKNGIKQSHILKHTKQHKTVKLHAKLNQDVQRFLKSASEVGIIRKNGFNYMLSDQVKAMVSDHNKSKKKTVSKPQSKPVKSTVKTPVSRRIEELKKKTSLGSILCSPKLLRKKLYKSKADTGKDATKVFKTLRSRVIFIKSV